MRPATNSSSSLWTTLPAPQTAAQSGWWRLHYFLFSHPTSIRASWPAAPQPVLPFPVSALTGAVPSAWMGLLSLHLFSCLPHYSVGTLRIWTYLSQFCMHTFGRHKASLTQLTILKNQPCTS